MQSSCVICIYIYMNVLLFCLLCMIWDQLRGTSITFTCTHMVTFVLVCMLLCWCVSHVFAWLCVCAPTCCWLCVLHIAVSTFVLHTLIKCRSTITQRLSTVTLHQLLWHDALANMLENNNGVAHMVATSSNPIKLFVLQAAGTAVTHQRGPIRHVIGHTQTHSSGMMGVHGWICVSVVPCVQSILLTQPSSNTWTHQPSKMLDHAWGVGHPWCDMCSGSEPTHWYPHAHYCKLCFFFNNWFMIMLCASVRASFKTISVSATTADRSQDPPLPPSSLWNSFSICPMCVCRVGRLDNTSRPRSSIRDKVRIWSINTFVVVLYDVVVCPCASSDTASTTSINTGRNPDPWSIAMWGIHRLLPSLDQWQQWHSTAHSEHSIRTWHQSAWAQQDFTHCCCVVLVVILQFIGVWCMCCNMLWDHVVHNQ